MGNPGTDRDSIDLTDLLGPALQAMLTRWDDLAKSAPEYDADIWREAARELRGVLGESEPPAFSCRVCDYTSDEYGDTHTHAGLAFTATTTAGFCGRCGQPVSTWHPKPQCDANYDRAYKAAFAETNRDHFAETGATLCVTDEHCAATRHHPHCPESD